MRGIKIREISFFSLRGNVILVENYARWE